MPDIESLLKRWHAAGVLDADAVRRIRTYEQGQARPAGLRWQGIVALILGAMLLACGVMLFVSAHWDEFGPGARYAIVISVVAVFHLGGALAREQFRGLSTTLHAVGTVATGAAIALVGQIFNIQEHWPSAILLWAIAALAGWALLWDEAQQILTLLLFPAWLGSELDFYFGGHMGEYVFLGRFLFVWSVLYLTVLLGTRRKAVQGVLFAAAAIAAFAGIMMQEESWTSWMPSESFLPLGTRIWGWIEIAVLPLLLSLVRLRKSLVPVCAAIVVALLLPWCTGTWRQFAYEPMRGTYMRDDPNLLARALVAGFAVFIIWWGVRQASRALVNLGIVGFAFTVVWFYFSDIFDKVGRSLGLIGLGILFLAGGWALETMRRRLITGMGADGSPQEAQ
jgi:uncharacterized membrane protein